MHNDNRYSELVRKFAKAVIFFDGLVLIFIISAGYQNALHRIDNYALCFCSLGDQFNVGKSCCTARQLFFSRHYGMVSEVLNVTSEYCLNTIFLAPLIIFGSEVMNGNAISVYVLCQVQYKP